MADTLMYITNDDTDNPFSGLRLVVETVGHSTYYINQSEFNKSPQNC